MAATLSFRLTPPHHVVRLVGRPPLLARLDKAREIRCLLVQAPAGYGKTVLLSQWREHLPASYASLWVTLDRDDGPLGLVRWLRTALVEAGLMAGPSPDSTLQAAQFPDAEEGLGAILHGLEQLRSDLVIILDEYHLAQSPDADSLLGRLLREMPLWVHVVIATRSRPSLPHAELRAQGQLDEIGPDLLRFSDQDAAGLFRTALEGDVVARLNRHVEGWPIALQLANLRIRHAADVPALIESFSGSVADMAEYMASQIFADLPGPLRDFLIETSILDRLDAASADAIRGRSDSEALLGQINRLDVLVTPSDRGRRLLRHHPLFAEFLHSRQSTLPAGRLTALHRAASHWFEREGDPLRAARHAREGQDPARLRLESDPSMLKRIRSF